MTVLWIRWFTRDFRRRWASIAAISLVVAFGTGTFVALRTTTGWRRESNATSFRQLRFHDFRVSLGRGVYVSPGDLLDVIEPLQKKRLLAAAEERLVVRTQVDASRDSETIVVPGRIVASGSADPLPVDALAVTGGQAARQGPGAVLLEHHFAEHYDLPAAGEVKLPGSTPVRYSGTALSPEYFVVTGEEAALLAESNFAVLFTSLSNGQELAGRPGEINELVLRARPGVPLAAVEKELQAAVDASLDDLDAKVTRGDQEEAFRFLKEDVKQDADLWAVIGILVLGCACFAVGNLTSRIVEAQRREIGIGMALGMSRRRLAARPLMVGLEIAVIGAAAGLVIGALGSSVIVSALKDLLPLPIWVTDWRPVDFALAALIGVAVPLVGAAFPTWRAVRAVPVTTIRVGHQTVRANTLVRLARRLPSGRSALRRMPLRNLLRSPRRVALTVLGITAGITAMIGTVGFLDSMVRTVGDGENELAGSTPDRVRVDFDNFYDSSSEEIRGVTEHAGVGSNLTGLRVQAAVENEEKDLDLLLQLQDLDSPVWHPGLRGGSHDAPTNGIVLSSKAARELAVGVGDTVSLRHLRHADGAPPTQIESKVRVAGIHRVPLRFAAFMPIAEAGLFGLEGKRNYVEVVPSGVQRRPELLRGLMEVPGVASAQPVTAVASIFRNLLKTIVGIFRFLQIAVLVLSALIAVVSSRITVEERMREHATLLAAGLRPFRVLSMVTRENFAIGLAGTVGGVLLGYGVVRWTVRDLLKDSLPEIDLTPYLAPTTLLGGFAIGLVVVALAPLLSSRRLRAMDLSGALRVVE